MNAFKDKKEQVVDIVLNLDLSYTEEDKKNIQKLIDSYFRLKKHFVNSKEEYIAGGLLWVYSRINFLFEHDEAWSQKELAGKLSLTPKSISRTSSHMMDSLRIDVFDRRFTRKEVIDKDPRNDFVMTKNGFILHKDDIANILLQQMKTKFGDIVELDSEKKIKSADLRKKKEANLNNDEKNRGLSEFYE